MKNKFLIVIIFAAAIFMTTSFNSKIDKKVIVIDAGHGGTDFGAQSCGLSEKIIVENIAKKINLFNENESDIEIILLRSTDATISLQDRIESINMINPALLISLHVNMSKNSELNGIDAFVSPNNKSYRKSVESANSLLTMIDTKNLKTGKVQDANFMVLRKTFCPAVLLEIGYLSNDNDFNYISNQNGQKEIAKKIYDYLKTIK